MNFAQLVETTTLQNFGGYTLAIPSSKSVAKLCDVLQNAAPLFMSHEMPSSPPTDEDCFVVVAVAIVLLLRLKLALEAALVRRRRVPAGGQLPQVQARRKKEKKDYKGSEWWRLYESTTKAADAYAAYDINDELRQLAAISFTITLIFGNSCIVLSE